MQPKLIAFFGILLMGLNSYAQNNTALTPDSALAVFQKDYPQEKVFVQTDRDQYVAGETIWMKSWCMLEGAPSFLSRIVYIILVNESGNVVQKKMYKLDSLGSAAATMELPEQTVTGNYTIKAYTLWMQNFPDFIFEKTIYIYGKDFIPHNALKREKQLQVHFFPEGGDMVYGLKSRVAFKATDENGFPVTIKGIIKDDKGKEVAVFQTEHDGLGKVELEPEQERNYSAEVSDMIYGNKSFPFPSIREEGISMLVENSNPNRLFVLLNRSEKNKDKYNHVTVVGQINGQLFYRAQLNFDEGKTTAPISKKNLPAGIMQLTVFDETNMPLAERICFIENYQLSRPEIHVNKINTSPRSINQISFNLPGVTSPTISCLVTSGYADTSLNQQNNIGSAFLVTSDLKGYIHNAGYYFKDKNPETLHNLDLLLMTQGWRRFNWKAILKNQFFTLSYPVESSITIRGKVFKSDRTEAIKEGKVSFIIKGDDSTSILADASVTDKGEFLLPDVNYSQQADVAYMGTDSKRKGTIVDVKLYPSHIDSLARSDYKRDVNLDTLNIAGRKSLTANYIYTQLAEIDTTPANYLGNITVKTRKLSKEDSLNRIYAGGFFQMGTSIDPGEFKSYRTVWQVLQQSVPGITVEGNPYDPTVSFNRFNGLGSESNSISLAGSSNGAVNPELVMSANGIAYFLNEVQVSKDIINTLTVDDLALIKVLKNEGAIVGASQGAIAFYTKKGIALRRKPYDKAYTVEKRAGYAVARQFYAPDYELYPGYIPAGKDTRATLFWGTRILQSADGQYHFRFSNNDVGKQFKLMIQGVDQNGIFIHYEKIIR